jgi:hypothetical protein
MHERWVQNVAGRGENGEQPGASAHDRVVGTDTPHGRAEFGVYTALPVLESGQAVFTSDFHILQETRPRES